MIIIYYGVKIVKRQVILVEIKIPSNILSALNLLNSHGFEAYVVGGCVRDAFLDKIADDWDVTTSATPEETKKVFADYRVIETGIKHGTIAVMIDDELIEITTMRVDGDYTDNRHPDSVEFTQDIHKDLSRRDFTINSMAYNPAKGLIDPFDGRGDIRRKLIRCVGDPDKRFSEDALRIMRALRFSSTLGFDIVPETAQSIIRNRQLLSNVAKERIRVELLKLLCGVKVKSILIDFAPVFFEIIPELEAMYKFPQNTPYHIYDIWEHTATAVEAVDSDPVLKMTMLLHDLGKPDKFYTDDNGIAHFKFHQEVSCEKGAEILKRLRFSKAEQEEITTLILYHDWRPDGREKPVLRFAAKHTPEFVLRLLPVLKADAMAQNPVYLQQKLSELKKTEEVVKAAIEKGACLQIKDLSVNGNDLMSCGFKGKEIGRILNEILMLVADGHLENKKSNILTYIKENFVRD